MCCLGFFEEFLLTVLSSNQGGGGFTAYNFFSNMIGLILIIVATIGFKLIFRTPWHDPATADLVTGHRELTIEEIAHLDAYHNLPLWRRIGTYVRMW